MMTGGEIQPIHDREYIFCTCTILMGALTIAILFGNIAVLMSQLNRKEDAFQQKQDVANNTMKNLKLPEELQFQISDYLIYTFGTSDDQQEFNLFVEMISPSLKNQVYRHIYSQLIVSNDLFEEQSSQLFEFLIKSFSNKFTKPEQNLIEQDFSIKQQMHFFFLARGECQVIVKDSMGVEHTVAILQSGSHFGEIALLSNYPRTATVTCLNYCTIAQLPYEDFKLMIQKFPHTVEVMKKNMQNYKDKQKEFIKMMIMRVPYLRGFNKTQQEELIYKLDPATIEQGDYLFKPGQFTNEIYFLTEGTIELSMTINDKALFQLRNEIYSIKQRNSIINEVQETQNSKYSGRLEQKSSQKRMVNFFIKENTSDKEDSSSISSHEEALNSKKEKESNKQEKEKKQLVIAGNFKIEKDKKNYGCLKKQTEIVPLKDFIGIRGSRHFKEKEETGDLEDLGQYPIEIVLDYLKFGTIFGVVGLVAEDSIRITQAKALTKCTVLTLSQEILKELRTHNVNLHQNLLE